MNSRVAELGAYWRERFPSLVYVPLAFALAGASLAGWEPGSEPITLAFRTALAYVLVFAFRLWDDLADRQDDRVHHPDRVLAKAADVGGFHLLLVLAIGVGAGLLVPSRDPTLRFAVYGGLCVFFFGWYGLARAAVGSLVLRTHILLIKYPIFVWLVAGYGPIGRPERLIVALGLIYALLLAYEIGHDSRVRAAYRELPIVRDMLGR